MQKTKSFALIISLCAILICMAIYLFLRSDSLWLFNYLQIEFIQEYIYNSRINLNPFTKIIPEWILYSLPDGLWVFSSLLCLLYIWDFKIMPSNYIFIFFIPFIAIASEFLQLLGIIIGYFDIKDVLFYILGILLALYISKPKLIKIHNVNPKKLQHISILSILIFYFIALSFFDFKSNKESIKIDLTAPKVNLFIAKN